MVLLSQLRQRPIRAAVLVVVIGQLLFTAGVRLYVVPVLLPHSHWRFGLQHLTDSQAFYETAVHLADAARDTGPVILLQDPGDRYRHVQVLAWVFYLTASNNAWWIYLMNAVLAGLSVCVLALLARACGLSPGVAAGIAAFLGFSPLSLFHYSDLLREPLIVPAIQAFWLGTILIIRPASARPEPRWRITAGALMLTSGFLLASFFRPYLMVPLMGALAVVLILTIVMLLIRWIPRSSWPRPVALAGTMITILVGFVVPSFGRVTAYANSGSPTTTAAQVTLRSEQARERMSRLTAGSNEAVQPEDLRPAGTCTVKWQRGFLPSAAERALESLACERQAFQRYCDPAVYGTRIDRNCDLATLASVGDYVRHLPFALAFATLTPFPNMWVYGFGSSGTGLRRVGYVIDGVVSYVLLMGLAGLFVRLPSEDGRPWPLILVSIGVLMVILLYAYAVPTQFILARMRLGFYRVLLVIAVYGWTRLIALAATTRPARANVR